MKNFVLLISLTLISLTVLPSSFEGGEITWTQNSNSLYTLKLVLHRYPGGLPPNGTQTIRISGTPLPVDSNNNTIGSITVTQLNISTNGAQSSYFVFESAPIELIGIPPSSGWKFSYTGPCCGPANSNTNFAARQNPHIQSTMYQGAFNLLNPNGGMFNNSPQFIEMPKRSYFFNVNYISNSSAVDYEGDSLVYRLGKPLQNVNGVVSAIGFRNGFSFSNYTGNQSATTVQIPYQIDPSTGYIQYLHNSTVGILKFQSIIYIDAYRNGIKTATVMRETFFTTTQAFSSINIPKFNKPVDFDDFGIYYDTVQVGQAISIPVRLIDTANSGDTMTLAAFGESFSRDYFNSTNCNNINDSSCATLANPLTMNNSFNPSRYDTAGVDSIITTFNWQTDCNHLSTAGTSKTHIFNFGYAGSNISNLMNYRAFSITVVPDSTPCNLTTKISSEPIDKEFGEQVQVYPNPTVGNFKILIAEDYDKIQVDIRTISGQLVNSSTYSNTKTIRAELPKRSGIYFVQLLSEDGQVTTMKMVKQ